MLEVSEVGFDYAGTTALDGVNLVLERGEILALLGPNGAGKSTLVGLISGCRRPSRGRVLLDGRCPWRRRAVRSRIGWVPQSITHFPRLTVEENLEAVGRVLGVRGRALAGRVDEVLALIGLEAKRRSRAERLSGGQQRLLNVGLGLVHSPQLLLLDEPTAGVDAAARQQLKAILRRLREQGLAILLTTHELEDASELADRLAVLVAGRIRAAGGMQAVIRAFFQNNREVSVSLAGGDRDEGMLGGCRQMLSEAGLESGGGARIWRGVMDNDRNQVDRLVRDALSYGHLIRELRVREPSLERLIERLSGGGEVALPVAAAPGGALAASDHLS